MKTPLMPLLTPLYSYYLEQLSCGQHRDYPGVVGPRLQALIGSHERVGDALAQDRENNLHSQEFTSEFTGFASAAQRLLALVEIGQANSPEAQALRGVLRAHSNNLLSIYRQVDAESNLQLSEAAQPVPY